MIALYAHPDLRLDWLAVAGGQVWRVACTPTGRPRAPAPQLARLLPEAERLDPDAERCLLGLMGLTNADWLDLLMEELRGRMAATRKETTDG